VVVSGVCKKDFILYAKKIQTPCIRRLLYEGEEGQGKLLHFLLLYFFIDHVAAFEFIADILGGDAEFDHENHYVIGEVGDFVDGFFLAVFGADDDLGGFLADLLQDFVEALLEEVGGIAALGEEAFAALKEGIEAVHFEFIAFLGREEFIMEAGFLAGMAGGAVGIDLEDEGVLIAVGGDGIHVQVVSAGFALEPEALAGSGIEAGELLFEGDFQAFAVHIGKGKHLSCGAVLNDCGNQAVCIKFQFVNGKHSEASLREYRDRLEDS